MRLIPLLTILVTATCAYAQPQMLSAQPRCPAPATTVEKAEAALDRLTGQARLDPARRKGALELIRVAVVELDQRSPTRSGTSNGFASSEQTADVNARMLQLYRELAVLLKPDVDLRSLTEADTSRRYLTITIMC